MDFFIFIEGEDFKNKLEKFNNTSSPRKFSLSNSMNKWNASDSFAFQMYKGKTCTGINPKNRNIFVNAIKEYACSVQKKESKNQLKHFVNLYIPHKFDITSYPRPAILIQLSFTLLTPYISHDDDDFYFIDNPVAKEKVYKVPMVRGTSWKGMLRHACFRNIWNKLEIDLTSFDVNKQKEKVKEELIHDHRMRITNLFGMENDNLELIWNGIYNDLRLDAQEFSKIKSLRILPDEEGIQGRLHFYTTFFENKNGLIDYSLINPHDRGYRFPKHGPILIETVPENSKGVMTILYFPYDLIRRVDQSKSTCNNEFIKKEINNDIQLVLDGLKDLFENYGISAKNKSDYGKCVVNNIIIQTNLLDIDSDLQNPFSDCRMEVK